MNLTEKIERKIMPNLETAMIEISSWKKNKEKIVFTNGCFDLFHAGHAHSLAESANYGSKLIVGINDDLSVKTLKGASRPFNTLKSINFSAVFLVPFSAKNSLSFIVVFFIVI
jgi:cytidyltransferase-like protein